MKVSVDFHADSEQDLLITVSANNYGNVVIGLSHEIYPRQTFFLTLLQFNQLRAAVLNFDVKTVKRA